MMKKFDVLISMLIVLNPVVAFAGGPPPGPAPLLGAVGGPWGMALVAACYGGYRVYKALR
jgi:hypothetical protein